jgi:cell division protein ZapA
MPEERITIGGRDFEVACQPGEEHYLQAAARMLDIEARTLIAQIGRIPAERMLLMAGLMLADKTAALEERATRAEADLASAQTEIARLLSRPAARVEVPAVPAVQVAALAELAARAEALAAQIEGRG